MSIQIGKHTLKSQVLLAPMAGTSDKPFRALCRQQGAALTPSEMLIIQQHLLASQKTKHRLDFLGEPAPISIQIAGSTAQQLVDSARQALEFGADIIDINMGCPAKKVCKKVAGSALMQDEKLVKDILNSVVNALDIPITLKMRTGWNITHKNAPTIAKIAQDAGVQMLSIHGRTREDKYKNLAEYDTIKRVVEQVSIPVIANGDITSDKKAQQVLQYTAAAGVMVGRAAQGNPWIIQQIDYYLKTGKHAANIALETKKQTILEHISQIHQFYGEQLGVRIARKHIFWYLQHFINNAQTFWANISKISNSKTQIQQLTIFLNEFN